MGFNPDSKELGPSEPRALQPTVSSQSKAAEAGHNQNRSIMATIADDDDRLLVRIGYTPVSAPSHSLDHLPTVSAGSTKTFLEMVYCFICHLDSRSFGLSARDLWCTNEFGWPSNSSMGLVHWQHHGILHSQFRYVCKIHTRALAKSRQVAELVSAYPTAGGMYYVTKHVVPPEHVAAWAWIIGWCNFLGQAAGVASLAYTISQMILATVVMHTLDNGESAFTP